MKVKQENGSVAIVVIVVILFIVSVLTTMYFSAVNRKNIGEEATKKIKQAYEKNVNRMDDLYATYQENGLYIYTKEDLENFRDRVNSGVTFQGKTVYLMNNIDLNAGNYTENEDGTVTFSGNAKQWEPIGNANYSFDGIFDGNGYEIRGLYINNSEKSHQGLFGKIKENSTIQNLGIINSKIIATLYVGGIVGWNNGGNIINCYNLAYIESIGNVASATNSESRSGGIVGVNIGIIEDCYNGGEIKGKGNHIGGIVGFNGLETPMQEGKVRKCYNYGNITEGKYSVGGIVGTNYLGIIEKSYNEGNLYIEGARNVGGIAGINFTKINDTYNMGNVKVNNFQNVGGIVGWMGYNNSESILSNSYCIGNIQGNGSVVGARNSNAKIVNNYYFNELSLGGINNLDVAGEAEQKSLEFMKSQEFVKLLGEENWKIEIGKNNGYPILK